MSAHVVGTLQLIDLSLASSAEAIKKLNSGPTASPEAIKQLLLSSTRIPDAHFWVIFIDAQGRGVAASNNLPIDGVSYADRPYFSFHAQDVKNGKSGGDGLFIGAPEIGRVSKRRIFFLSRRVTSATGEFLGVVAAPVDASAFATVFANALFQPALSITLVHNDGKIIARAPKFNESFASSIVESTLYKKMRMAPSGTYEAKSVVDSDTRIYSYKVIENMPLVVSVGMANNSWTDGLIDDVLVASVGLLVIIAVLFFSGNFALISYRRLATSEGSQRRLNDELRRVQNQLALLARTDALTGLPNRNHLYDRLSEAFARSRRTNTKLSCLYLDLDHFKQVNDTLGHAGGDDLLKQFGMRLQGCVRQTDMVARLAGDEFVVLIEGLERPEDAGCIATKVVDAMQHPFTLAGIDRLITTSIGVAIADSQTDDPDSLLKKADAALYEAKRLGKNMHQFYKAPAFTKL